QTPRQALNQVTELPRTSKPIPNVADEAVYEEWDNRVERATTIAARLDGIGAGDSPRYQEAIGSSIAQTRSKRELLWLLLHIVKKINLKISWESLVQLSTASRLFSIVEESVSTNGASMLVSTASMVQQVNISIPLPVVVKDKGKGKMEESEDEQTKRTKLQQEQDRLGYEAAEEWENIRVRVEADEELSRRLQAEERNKYSEVNQAKMLQLKRYSFDEFKELFETIMKNVHTFVPMETEDRGRASELAAGSSQETIIDSAEVGSTKKDAKAELDHESSKRQKTNEASGSVQEQPEEEEKDLSQEDLQQMMMVVSVEEVYVEALHVKYPIIDLEVYTEESRKYWKIIRVGNHTEAYQFFEDMLKIFDRDDLLVEKEYSLSKGVMTLMLVNKLLVEHHSKMANELLRKSLYKQTDQDNKVFGSILSAQMV
ncbi:hypothetical protein Tco_0959148, partial [Tanacetum coccineum]